MADRNYLTEAAQIAEGQSSLLPEVDHVKALAGQMESVLRDNRRMSELVAAVMIDTAQTTFVLPEALLEHVRNQGLELTIQTARGFIEVKLFRRPLASGRVM